MLQRKRYPIQFLCWVDGEGMDYNSKTVFMICGGILRGGIVYVKIVYVVLNRLRQNKITGQNCNPKLVFGHNSYCKKNWRRNHKRDKTEPRCHTGHEWAQCYPWIIVRRDWINIWCRSHGFHLFETIGNLCYSSK